MEPSLFHFQGFDAFGKGLEFTLLQVRQTLAWLWREGWWTTAWGWRGAGLTRLAPVTVTANIFTHTTIAFKGIDRGDDAIQEGAVVRSQQQCTVVCHQKTLEQLQGVDVKV